ncbi:MAG: dockerin type I repeat-containing protein, partial [Ruminococcus sp.]|nr:dockerin type I repeat-containing protein [Ruminococcus sp.]
NIPSEYYDIGESPNYPDGTENFDNMIFVIDPDVTSIAELSGMATCGGEWYYYYGNGCYGFTADGDETNCLRDDHFDENGNHVGKQTPSEPDTKPTEPSAPHPSYVVGDADGDGEVSIMDATQIQLIVAGLVELTDDVKLAADADGDGEVSIMDATQIQLMVAGLI